MWAILLYQKVSTAFPDSHSISPIRIQFPHTIHIFFIFASWIFHFSSWILPSSRSFIRFPESPKIENSAFRSWHPPLASNVSSCFYRNLIQRSARYQSYTFSVQSQNRTSQLLAASNLSKFDQSQNIPETGYWLLIRCIKQLDAWRNQRSVFIFLGTSGIQDTVHPADLHLLLRLFWKSADI